MPQILPGITAIGWVPCSQLMPAMPQRAMAGLPVAVYGPINWLDIQGEASCASTSQAENNGPYESTTLSFHTTSAMPSPAEAVAYVVRAAEGSLYLVGAREPPHPVAKITRHLGVAGNERAGYDVEISCKGVKNFFEVSA